MPEEVSTNVEDALRSFCARILGWTDERASAVEHAIRSIHLSVTYRAALVLLGETDLVPIAYALHRRTLGADRPFIVCDPRRRDGKDYVSVRSPINYGTGIAAFEAAIGGSLCVRSRRLPRDFSSVVARIRATSDVQIIVCSDRRDDTHPFLTLPVPIGVPSLAVRTGELPRIVDEYAVDAAAELRPLGAGFTAADREWVLQNAPLTLAEIEKATLRLVAIRASRNMSAAAERLGMAPVSLSRWLDRRKLLSPMAHDPELGPLGTPEREHDHSASGEENELGRELEASIAEADAGQTIDFAEAMAELRAKRSEQGDD
jgi:ActR/RegA family two-component response regulator